MNLRVQPPNVKILRLSYYIATYDNVVLKEYIEARLEVV